jgi:CHAT domain/SIR2-like domain
MQMRPGGVGVGALSDRHAALEIVLARTAAEGRFNVSFAYDDPSDDLDRRDLMDDPIEIDCDAIADLEDDDDAYGRRVGALLFSGDRARSFYDSAVATAQRDDVRVHLRLNIDPSADARFHQIRWEAMRDPATGDRIATKRNVLLSRYMMSRDWRRLRLPPWHTLKALAVIASPTGVENRDRVGMTNVPLPPIDADAELARAREALSEMDVTELAERGDATLERILAEIDKGIDVLYLACHGGYVDGAPQLYLEDKTGAVEVVDGRQLADRIGELDHQPSLVVLCSCMSSGPGADDAFGSDKGVLSWLGPRLAAKGVAAVIGMQGNVTMSTASAFLESFFAEVRQRSGMVDLAVAIARSRVATKADWWMPVLYSRLLRGRAWYKPEFAEEGDRPFDSLVAAIADGACTPILGSGVAGERLIPSREDIAREWADRWLVPVSTGHRLDLAKVAQYLGTTTAPKTVQTAVRLDLARGLRTSYREALPAELHDSKDPVALIRAVGEAVRHEDGDKYAYKILADLKLPIYITTSWTSLLEDAIVAEGREPVVGSFAWHRTVAEPDHTDEPDPDHPLVYHLFGTLDDRASLVVTEDHYFAWLREWNKRVDKDDSIPGCVKIAMSDASLLFLGYDLDDWEFRVLYNAHRSIAGWHLMRDNLHVGVQVSPEGRTVDAQATQGYLGSYFGSDNVRVYWGSCASFLRELARRRKAQND